MWYVLNIPLLQSSQLQSFGTPSYVGSGSIAESAGEGSLSSYFVKKSDILGDLTAVKLPPQERVNKCWYTCITRTLGDSYFIFVLGGGGGGGGCHLFKGQCVLVI